MQIKYGIYEGFGSKKETLQDLLVHHLYTELVNVVGEIEYLKALVLDKLGLGQSLYSGYAASAGEVEGLFDFMTEKLSGKVKAVRLSHRLKSHPVCITSEGMLSVEMEKVLPLIDGTITVDGNTFTVNEYEGSERKKRIVTYSVDFENILIKEAAVILL